MSRGEGGREGGERREGRERERESAREAVGGNKVTPESE